MDTPAKSIPPRRKPAASMASQAPAAVSPETASTSGRLMFLGPDIETWKELNPEVSTPEDAEKGNEAKAAKAELKSLLLSSLQMQHVVVLAGSGTSLGPAKGPSMGTLWDFCVNSNPGNGSKSSTLTPRAARVIKKTGYDLEAEDEGPNIESLLSHCEAYVQVKGDKEVAKFLVESKSVILEKCSEFIDSADTNQLAAHRIFLHRLSRRRARDSRLKLFTTNYDLCFEIAAAQQGLVALDGFSFTQPRQFDPRFFQYDIVRRPATGDEVGTPLEGVFHLYKLHGSVNWSQTGTGGIEVVEKPEPKLACLIYPAKGKYQQSYVQPHLELVSQYFSALREPNTCLIVAGFGFNDDHFSEPILAAARTNPHLRLIIVNPSADDQTARPQRPNKYWRELFGLAKQGEDVWMVNAYFGDFAAMIPDLKSLTPAQRITRDIRLLAGAK